jgi:ATP:ADP antiporter, AAA family
MTPTPYMLRMLNVRANEWSLVRRLFIFEFFQGAGIAFFFTASLTLFLNQYSVEELPKVYIYSSFLLWISGYIYSRLEAKLKIVTLARVLTIFMAASFLFFRLSVEFMPSYFLYLMFAWFNVLYLLNNLEFWGISSLLFDVRQSKRLFAIISGGDIPAKFVGYSMALVLVGYIGTPNLLLAGFFCMIASLPFLNKIKESDDLKKHDEHHHGHHGHHNGHKKLKHHTEPKGDTRHAAHPVGHLVKNFTVNTLIRRIAYVTVIASAVFIIANFAFYAKVKEAFTTDVGLAQFIAMFFAIVRVAAMVIKIVFTGRLINNLGTVKSLLVTPVLMLFLVGAVLLLEYYVPGQSAILYLFGVMAIFVDILRTAINTPVFLTLMQPLSTHERLRAHTITKGIMDPFAYLFTGLLLMAVLEFEHSVHIQTLNFIMTGLGIFWIIGIYRINHQYLKTLLKTIGNRFFNNTEFSLTDSYTLNWLKQKLVHGDEVETSNILKMVAMNNTELADDILLSALQHPSEKIRTQVLQLAEQRNILHSEELIRPILQAATDSSLKAEAIKVLSRIHMREEEIISYVEYPDVEVQSAAIIGLIRYGNFHGKQKVINYLQLMVDSEDEKVRAKAAIILQDLQDPEFTYHIIRLMRDADLEVRRQAFIAASKTGDDDMMLTVLSEIGRNEKIVVEALFIAGKTALPLIKEYILSHQSNPKQIERLIRLIGRIGGEESHEVLMELVQDLPWFPQVIFRTLYHSGYKAGAHQHYSLESQVRLYLNSCARILYMQKLLEPHKVKYHILSHSLELELHCLRDTLLYIFAILYDRDQVKNVRTAFLSGGKESIANAMEIIEMTVKKDIASCFNIIFEVADIEEKVYSLKKLYPLSFFTNVENVLRSILVQEEYRYDNWTTACSIYTSKKQRHNIETELISKYIGAEHPLLSEVAKFATLN